MALGIKIDRAKKWRRRYYALLVELKTEQITRGWAEEQRDALLRAIDGHRAAKRVAPDGADDDRLYETAQTVRTP